VLGKDRGGRDDHPPRRLQTFAKLVTFAPRQARRLRPLPHIASARVGAYAVGQEARSRARLAAAPDGVAARPARTAPPPGRGSTAMDWPAALPPPPDRGGGATGPD
jgi:hypothetical protein